MDRSMEGVPGPSTAQRWRAARGGVLGASRAGPPRADRVGSATGNVSDDLVRLRFCRTSRAEVIGSFEDRPNGRASEIVAGSQRRPIAASPGVEGAGNGTSALAARSALPTRVSARVTGESSRLRVTSAQAQGSGLGRLVGARDNWSAAEIVKGHLAPSTVGSSEQTAL